MGYTVYNYVSLANEADLTTPTSSQGQYRLGDVVRVDLSVPSSTGVTRTGEVKKYMYVKANGALTAYQPYVIVPGTTSGSEWVAQSATTSTTVCNLACIPQVSFTSGYYGFVQIEGKCTAKIAATTHTIGDCLELISAATTLTPTTTSGSTTFGADTVAICNSVSTGAESASVMLVGRQTSIAAS